MVMSDTSLLELWKVFSKAEVVNGGIKDEALLTRFISTFFGEKPPTFSR
jgi:hypothetical protein